MTVAILQSALTMADSLRGRLLVEAVDPFVAGAAYVLEKACRESFTKGRTQVIRTVSTVGDWNALVGVVGERIAGVVSYSMDDFTARRVAARMVGHDPSVLGEIELSALDEMANMITGQASIRLETSGLRSYISPPQFLSGPGRFISAHPLQWLVVPLKTGLGVLTVSIALRQSDG